MWKKIVRTALQEDCQDIGDITSEAVFKNEIDQFILLAKDKGVLCGFNYFKKVFLFLDKDVEIKPYFKDGDQIKTGDIICKISGKIVSILTGERIALNILSHLSGIATRTALFVEAAQGKVKILDTRKTLPGLRELQKYAVRCGGGFNHRMGLHDMVMLKNNHIDSCGGITAAMGKVRKRWGKRFMIEVETRTLEEVKEALACRVDRIMLDNMDIPTMKEAVEMIQGKIEVEASGNMTLERIAEVALTGVDFISVGELTHSVNAFDFSLRKMVK
ncbi:MAG: carboxylating nicotinate-nucleotide diphosphorylase [Candidatus Cloacimonetes bacterium]|nr:carboxylating nicotinate-nucleotide diphosphorylase [Candidatus Cloacimonadota bacterium]MBL7148953.1 carboxylating nicotinate-nucleotide diphosphorylase [Candidatus Cloacimonadota bacterium]